MSKQIARDIEVARIHAEEELQSMIDGSQRGTKELLEDHQVGRKLSLLSVLCRFIKASGQGGFESTMDLSKGKLYDLSGVHQVTAKDKEIFMLVEKDYPLRKDLVLVMICYKLQVENFSQMANDLVLKIYKIANSSRQQEGTSHCPKKNATARIKVMPLSEDCTAIIVKKKLSVKDDGFLNISAPCPALYSSSNPGIRGTGTWSVGRDVWKCSGEVRVYRKAVWGR
nr:hypothetical protein [Tanacetum cinerariifolium]